MFLFLLKPAPGKENDSIFWGVWRGWWGQLQQHLSLHCLSGLFSWFVWLGRCPLSPPVLHVRPSWSFALCWRGHSSQVEGGWETGPIESVLFFPSDQDTQLGSIDFLRSMTSMKFLPSFVYAFVWFLGKRVYNFHQVLKGICRCTLALENAVCCFLGIFKVRVTGNSKGKSSGKMSTVLDPFLCGRSVLMCLVH